MYATVYYNVNKKSKLTPDKRTTAACVWSLAISPLFDAP